MSAVLQIEIDRNRIKGMKSAGRAQRQTDNELAANQIINDLALIAVWDTIINGGVFVLVSSDDKLTIVQREIEEEDKVLTK